MYPVLFVLTVVVIIWQLNHFSINYRGLDFRPAYRRANEIAGLVSAPVLALTGTATTTIFHDIDNVLCLTEPTVVCEVPDRRNVTIHMDVVPENVEEQLKWFVEHVKSGRCGKTIIYVQTVNTCSKIYHWMKDVLDGAAYEGPQLRKNLIIGMVHASTPADAKAHIMEDFPKQNGILKILIATVAFGMGVNIPDVRQIIHWGLPDTTLLYWQELGRAGRDGEQAISICYAFKRSITTCKEACLKELCKSGSCVRHAVLGQFSVNNVGQDYLDQLSKRVACPGCDGPCKCSLCMCCTRCHAACTCENKAHDILSLFFPLEQGTTK